MINYSEKTSFEVFKRELLLDRFFCKSNKPMSDEYTFDYLELPTNTVIKNSFIYKLAQEMIEKNSQSFKCNIREIYKGNQDISLFKRNFIYGLYKESLNKKVDKKFLDSFEKVFDIIISYDKKNLLDMYVLEDFNILSNTITNETNQDVSVAYKFIWDLTGYSFGKIQFNLGTNIISINNVGVKFLKSIGFNDEEINLLTKVPSKYSAEQLKTNSSVAKAMTNRVSHLNYKLYKHKNDVDNFCKKSFFERIKLINSYETTQTLIYENEIPYIQLIDYDNQLRFDENGYFNNFLKNKISKKDYILTNKEIIEFKLTKLLWGQTHPEDIHRRNNNIVKNVRPALKNAKFEDVIKIITPDLLFDIISINEIGNVSDNIHVHNIVSRFKTEVFGNFKTEKIEVPVLNIKIDDKEITDSKNESEQYAQNKVKRLNEVLDIPSEFSEDTVLNAHNIIDMTVVMKKLFTEFCNKYFKSETNVNEIIKNSNKKFIKLCKSSNGLTSNLEDCEKSLKEINDYIKTLYDSNDYDYSKIESKEANVISAYFENLYKAYGYMMKNEFAKTNLLATGIINKANAFLFSDSNAMQVFADSFMATKPKLNLEYEQKEINPLSVFFSKSDFLYMKELDYRNLEASLRQSSSINPSSLGCQRTWILIYIILNFIARKNVKYTDDNKKQYDDFINHASSLLSKIKQQEWNYKYSDTEKHFSMLYPFVKFQNNPFTDMMNDKGFNSSQETAKELRIYVEKQMKQVIDSVKEFVYGENKIYDIFQGIADIAYELSTPMTLYADFDISDAGESIVNQFLNACVSSLEMQTAMTIYEFLFNFEITIDGKQYSLNDLNNMLKMFNLIIEVSKNNEFNQQLVDRSKICRHTSDYKAFKQIGFYTYNKKWNKNYDGMDKYIKDFSGFYLSDEEMLFDIVEYCRHKKAECLPGDLKTIVNRFNNLREYEWISAFACYKLRNEDKKYSNQFSQNFINDFELGYIQIQNICQMLEMEANNTNPEVTFLNPYLENLGNEIIADSTEFDKFKKYNEEMFKRFRVNMISNEKVCLSIINKNLSDNKIYDWMMKMLPTYEMIAKAFGFASLNGLSTLDKFVDGLMSSLNLIIKITFDKWKTETAEAIKVRRINFIAKERYYYLQSIPVMIDWTIKNLEHYILGCNFVTEADGIDFNQSSQNLETLDGMMKTFIIKLKEEVSIMSSLQIKEFEKELRKSILSIDGIDKEKANELINNILQINSAENFINGILDSDTSFLSDEQKKELMNNISKNINIKIDK